MKNIENDETVTIKQAKANLKKCSVPLSDIWLPLPTSGSSAEQFESYNNESYRVFFEHVKVCLWCRMYNPVAIKAAQDEADADARRRAEEEEEARRRKALEDEEARRRKQLEDEEDRLRRLAEDEERRRREAAEEARRQKVLEDEEARRRAAEEELRRKMLEDEEEARRKKLLLMDKHKFLRRGEGTIAATQSAKVIQDKESAERARQDIATYSLYHAKNKGLVSATVSGKDKPAKKYEELDDETAKKWESSWTEEEEKKFAESTRETASNS